MIKKLTILFLFICALASAQNEFMYRQYMLNQLQFNPGYTGSREIMVAGLLSRAGMIKIDGSPRTISLTLDAPFKNSSALGGTIIGERIGNTDHYNFDANYAYRVQLRNAGKLSFGLKLSANVFTSRPLQNLQDNDDELFYGSTNTYFLPNSGFGLYFYNFNKYFIGVSIPTLLSYQDGGGKSGYSIEADFVKMISNYHYIGSAGVVLFRENENFKLRLSTMAEFDISSLLSYDMNAMGIIKNMIWLGGTYYSGGIAAFIAQWQVNPQMRIGYSYDYNIANYLKELGGGHEIMIRYEFSYIIKAVSPIF